MVRSTPLLSCESSVPVKKTLIDKKKVPTEAWSPVLDFYLDCSLITVMGTLNLIQALVQRRTVLLVTI